MKKRVLVMLLSLFVCLSALIGIAGCFNEESGKTVYLIAFIDSEGTLLKAEEVKEGEMPIAPTATTPENTAEYSYTGVWDKEIVVASIDTTYTWVVTSTKNSYLVRFINEEGDSLKEETLEYGETPVAPKMTVPNNTVEYTYSGEWDKEIVAVSGEETYTWMVSAIKNSYTITFVDEEGTILNEESVEYGIVPTTPTVTTPDNTAEYTYSGEWDKEIVAVSGEETYTWIVSATTNSYTIKFVDSDETILKEETIEYGTIPVAPTATIPENTAEYTYSGAWDKEIVAVSDDTTYTWVISQTKNKYQVTFDSENATEYEYGSNVKPLTPSNKQGKAFSKWTLEGKDVDFTIYTVTEAVNFVSEWNDIPYATSEYGYINAASSTELGEGSWYYEIGTQSTVYTWTVYLPMTEYAVDKTTTYTWKDGDWSSVGLAENDRIASGGTVRQGTLAVTNIGGKLYVVLNESTQNITKTAYVTDADIIGGSKPLTIYVNNGARYRHFYLGAATVTNSEIDTIIIDSENNIYAATKGADSVEYSLSKDYGEGSLTLPKIDFTTYAKVTCDWNIAGGWTFIGVDDSHRWYDVGNALGGTITVTNINNEKLVLSMVQTVNIGQAGTFTLEITDEDVIKGNKSITLSFNCLVGTQKLVLNNIVVSTK